MIEESAPITMPTIHASAFSSYPTRRASLLFLACVLSYFAFGLSVMTPQHPWGDDWAQYVLHAQNIVQGRPYAAIGYVFNPDFPNVGPPSYPPGLPLLLVAPIAWFGVNIFALKAACFAALALSLVVAFELFRAQAGSTRAAIAVALFAFHPLTWSLTQWISSEAPYIALSLLTLWLASRQTAANRAGWPALAAGAVIGVSLYGTVICRSVGIALLPALILFGWGRRQPSTWFAGLVLTFGALVVLQTRFFVTPPTYSNELKIPTPTLFYSNVVNYLRELGGMFPLPAGLSKVSGVLLTVLASIGIYRSRVAAGRLSVAAWYLCFYLLALLLVPIEPSSRYLLPVLPIVLFLTVEGVDSIVSRIQAKRWYALAIILGVAAYYVQLHRKQIPENEKSVTCAECTAMFGFVRENTDPDAVIVFAKPRAMAVYSGRHSWRAADGYSGAQLAERMRSLDARYMVVGAPGSEFAYDYPTSKAVDDAIHGSDATVIFRNSMFEVVQLGRPQ